MNIQNALLAMSLLFAANTMAQTEYSCSAKERFKSNYRIQNHKDLKSASDYDVHYYKLDLLIENNSTYIEGSGTIGARAVNQMSSVQFELHNNFNIDSILIGGSAVSFTQTTNVVTVTLSTPLSANSLFYIDVYYKGTAPTGGGAAIGDGFSTDVSGAWGNSATWSLSEPYAAYEWFPVKQVLSDKADSSEVWVTTSDVNMAGSNGVLMNVTTLPNNKKRYEWKSNFPIAYYLISVAVAEYVDYTIYAQLPGMNDSVKIVNYIYNNPQTLPNFKDEIDKTAEMIEVFSEKFGIYPFYKEKYGHCMAPFGGGMEHQTMTTQGFFFTDLTSHELGHQWFGDHVTCGSWSDIWVNEGFASYTEYVFIEDREPSRGPSWLTDTENSALSSPTGSVYVDDTTNVGRIFSSSLSYNKGAFLLHMLRFEIDDDALFFKAMRDYSSQFAMSTAKGTDVKDVMESVTGMNFDDFFDQWYFGQGFPWFNITWNQDLSKNLDMVVQELVTAAPVTPLFNTHLELSLSRFLASDTIIKIYIDQNTKEYTIPNVRGVVNDITIDPNNWILDGGGDVERDPNLNLGIDETDANREVVLFPNPTSDLLSVRSADRFFNAKASIYNTQGEIIRDRLNINGFEFTIETNDLAAGTYLLEIREGDSSLNKLFVVEH